MTDNLDLNCSVCVLMCSLILRVKNKERRTETKTKRTIQAGNLQIIFNFPLNSASFTLLHVSSQLSWGIKQLLLNALAKRIRKKIKQLFWSVHSVYF